MFNTSWRILWQLSIEIPLSYAIWSTDFLLSLLALSHARSTFASFDDIDGQTLYRSLSTLSCPSYKCLWQSYTWDFLISLSSYACWNMVNVSAGDFCSKRQDLIFIRCSVTGIFNCNVTPHTHTLKKQTTTAMPLEVTKWQNYFCDDHMSADKLWDRNFPHTAIPVNYTSKLQKLFEATTYLNQKTD